MNRTSIEIPLNGIDQTEESIVILSPGKEPWVLQSLDLKESNVLTKIDGKLVSVPLNSELSNLTIIHVEAEQLDDSISVPLANLISRKYIIDIVADDGRTQGFELIVKPNKREDGALMLHTLKVNILGDRDIPIDLVATLDGTDFKFIVTNRYYHKCVVSLREGPLTKGYFPKHTVYPQETKTLGAYELISYYTRKYVIDIEGSDSLLSFDLLVKPYFDNGQQRELVTTVKSNILGDLSDVNVVPILRDGIINFIVQNNRTEQVSVILREI